MAGIQAVKRRSGALLWTMVALVVLGWSANYVAGKVALRSFPAALLSPLRLVLAAAFILPAWAWQRRGAAAEERKPGDLWTLLLVGTFGAALTQFLWVFGLSRTSVAHSVIFSNLSPMLVLLLAAVRGLERITPGKLAGLVLALGGVAMLKWLDMGPIAGTAAHSTTPPTVAGDAICFAGSAAFALFNVWGKPATKRHSAISVTTYGYIGGAIAVAPLLVWQAARFPFSQVPLAGWAAVIYMSLISSGACYLMYYRVLAQIEASRATAFCYLQPPFATIFGALLLAEPVSMSLIVSGVVILAGLLLAEWSR